jgi:hypothetical protein
VFNSFGPFTGHHTRLTLFLDGDGCKAPDIIRCIKIAGGTKIPKKIRKIHMGPEISTEDPGENLKM